MRLRFVSGDNTTFATTGAPVTRSVYLADVQVLVTNTASNSVVFTGVSDLAGEVKLPKLAVGQSYSACFSTALV